MIEPIYPPPDPERESRICTDVIDLMKMQKTEESNQKVARWLQLTLAKAQRFNRLPWWFAKRLLGCRIFAGQDMFDLTGAMDRIIAAYCLEKLKHIPLGTIIQRRNNADCHQRINSGEPRYYCFDGGRLHLWPAPDKDMLFIISYACPLEAAIVPAEWETILLDGIIGLYARFFDSSALVNKENGQEFLPRFWEGLKATRSHHFDSETFERQLEGTPKQHRETLYTAWAESALGSVGALRITPTLRGTPGDIQIPADKGMEHKNKPGVPITQIPGNYDPTPRENTTQHRVLS